MYDVSLVLLFESVNKVLTTGYFNNSLRNKIQNFLNSGQLINQKEAIKQIDNTLKGLDTTIYHNGNYYGGQITPSVERQIKKLGFDKFDIQEDVVKNIKEQDAAIAQLQGDLELQGKGLQEQMAKNAAIQGEMNRYLDIFKRHNLTKLAAAKPGLIEPRANKATKEVFDGIEEDSRNIDDLDDGIQLQSGTN